MKGLTREDSRMNDRLRIAICALLVAFLLGLAGCAGESEEKIVSNGYLPNEITNIENGGEFDASALTPSSTATALTPATTAKLQLIFRQSALLIRIFTSQNIRDLRLLYNTL